MAKLKAVYYVNQFYAGIGGEEKADIGLKVFDEKKGPAIGIEKFWQEEMEIAKVISCGDNFINNDEKYESILPKIDRILQGINPDVFIAGPAFNAGRYGVACAKLCDYVRKNLNIPSVTAMYYENPAVQMYIKDNYIVESPETSAGMKKTLPTLAKLSLKLAKREEIGPARVEGYLPTGYRYNEYHQKTGAERVVEILMKKLNGEEYITEVPLRGLEKVNPAVPIKDVEEAKVALITTGGLVPIGNPDKLKQAFSVTYGRYNIANLDSISIGKFNSIHGGYDTTIVNEDPNRLLPLDELRVLEREGYIKEIHEEFFTTCGIGTNVENSKKIGRGIVEDLEANGVNAAILTSTWGTCTRCVATISKELDKNGIPNAVITAFTSIAYNVGANRIIYGGNFTNPVGNPELPIEREKFYRRNILLKSLEAVSTEVTEPTIFNVDESKED